MVALEKLAAPLSKLNEYASLWKCREHPRKSRMLMLIPLSLFNPTKPNPSAAVDTDANIERDLASAGVPPTNEGGDESEGNAKSSHIDVIMQYVPNLELVGWSASLLIDINVNSLLYSPILRSCSSVCLVMQFCENSQRICGKSPYSSRLDRLSTVPPARDDIQRHSTDDCRITTSQSDPVYSKRIVVL